MQELKRILNEAQHKLGLRASPKNSEQCPVCDFELLREGYSVKIPSYSLDAWLCPKCKSIFDMYDNTLIRPMTLSEEGLS